MLIMADPTIVLVHGAFADASSWSRLYAELSGDGLAIKAPANPLRGVTVEDARYTKCVIEQIEGPVLLVGHSPGGAVIDTPEVDVATLLTPHTRAGQQPGHPRRSLLRRKHHHRHGNR
jgi:thioesterase domain-containing protein